MSQSRCAKAVWTAALLTCVVLLAPPLSRAEDQMPAAAAAQTAKPSGSTKLDFVGAEACLSCHQDKEAFRKNIHAKAMPNEKGVQFAQACETCHGPGSLHAGAGGDKSNPDFYTIRNPRKMKPGEVTQTCLQCHSGGRRMHWEGSAHESKNVACVNCHSVHDAQVNEGKSPLLAGKTQAEVCYQCHAEKRGQIAKSAHMPMVEGKMGCTSCHNPHGSTTEKLLAKKSVPETCYQCHQDKRGPFLWEHPPVRKDCRNCHDPHGSSNDYLLTIKPPFLCERCHQNADMGGRQHDRNSINSQDPFVLDHSCMNCHSKIHGSNHPGGKRLVR